jgi:glycosyltransferase involved in cell wall biosynthesis
VAGNVVVRCTGILDGKKPGALTKTKILILVDWYEPGFKAGGPIQSVRNFVQAMQDVFDISILTSDRDIGETHPYPDVPYNQWISREPGVSVYYAGKDLLNSKKIRSVILDKSPDFIYLNSLYSYHFSILPLLVLWRNKLNTRIVLAPRGMLQEGAMQSKTVKKKLFIGLLNSTGIVKKIRFQGTDNQEKEDIKQHFPKAESVVQVSNFSAPLSPLKGSLKKLPGVIRIIYISRITPKKNILFFIKLLAGISYRVKVEFAIFGEIDDARYWREAELEIRQLPENINVSYKGALPHAQVIETMEAHHIFVLPTRGENFGHTIFEAFSAGRPVLISDKTPWRGLYEKKAGWDLSLDEPQSWIKTIEEAAGFDQPAFDCWCLKSREYAQEHLNKSNLKQEYKILFS